MTDRHGGLPHVIVVDDHDDVEPYLILGEGHYPPTKVEWADNGALVVTLNFHEIYRHFRRMIRNPPSSYGLGEDPGTP